jgi:hypothetical protein
VPRDEGRRESTRREQPGRGGADREDRRLGVLGERELILGAVENDAAQRLAERGVGLGERLTAERLGVGQRAAHADLLRTLAGKEEGDHW